VGVAKRQIRGAGREVSEALGRNHVHGPDGASSVSTWRLFASRPAGRRIRFICTAAMGILSRPLRHGWCEAHRWNHAHRPGDAFLFKPNEPHHLSTMARRIWSSMSWQIIRSESQLSTRTVRSGRAVPGAPGLSRRRAGLLRRRGVSRIWSISPPNGIHHPVAKDAGRMNRAVGAHGLWADEPGPLAQAGMKRTFGPETHSANASSSSCSTILRLVTTPTDWLFTSPLAK